MIDKSKHVLPPPGWFHLRAVNKTVDPPEPMKTGRCSGRGAPVPGCPDQFCRRCRPA